MQAWTCKLLLTVTPGWGPDPMAPVNSTMAKDGSQHSHSASGPNKVDQSPEETGFSLLVSTSDCHTKGLEPKDHVIERYFMKVAKMFFLQLFLK